MTAVMTLAACGGSSGAAAPASSGTSPGSTANTIVIKSFMFHPASLTVSPGATVMVHNEDSVTHTLSDKADPKLFSTGDVSPNQTKTIKAPSKAGSYPFICQIHQYMAGTLVVR
jgi:plastocyanin